MIPTISEIDLTRRDLASFDLAGSFRLYRAEEIRLYWMPLKELGIYILNIFAPIGYVFWSFDGYDEFQSSQQVLLHVLSSKNLADAVDGICVETKTSAHSVFASILLRSITAGFGERFYPEASLTALSLLDRRHMCFAVPMHCRSTVSKYFRGQTETFGTESLRLCDEEISLTRLEIPKDRLQSKPHLRLLESAIGVLDQPARENIARQIKKIGGNIEIWRSEHIKSLDYYDRGISVSLNNPRIDATFYDDLSVIYKFRINYALRYLPIGALERLSKVLVSPAWRAEEFSSLYGQLRFRLDEKLEAYFFIHENPLA